MPNPRVSAAGGFAAIVPRRIDPESGTPAFKSVVARVERVLA